MISRIEAALYAFIGFFASTGLFAILDRLVDVFQAFLIGAAGAAGALLVKHLYAKYTNRNNTGTDRL